MKSGSIFYPSEDTTRITSSGTFRLITEQWSSRLMFSAPQYPVFPAGCSQKDEPDRSPGVKTSLCKTAETVCLEILISDTTASDEVHFCLNGYVNKQNCRIWSEANPQVYVETPLHPEKLTVWCALWAGGILLQKR
ncbi:hypothetical protein TNCV_1035421 [Trichonephila clavipes]|nr:hypothetical protein TNCV_1035421 [Trichonephila clavipes]